MNEAREALAARLDDDDGGCRVDRIGPDLQAAIAEIDRLTAENKMLRNGAEAWRTVLPVIAAELAKFKNAWYGSLPASVLAYDEMENRHD
jgi:hypothetical protein